MASELKNIDAQGAAKLKQNGALMVDVREMREYAAQRMPGSTNIALSKLEASELSAGDDRAIVFFCASGARTSIHADRLAAKAGGSAAYVMEGGLSAWGRAGLPVENGGGGGGNGLLSRIIGSIAKGR